MDNETKSLLRINDIVRDYESMTPRSGTSLLVEKLHDESTREDVKLDSVFKLAKGQGKNTADRDELTKSFRTCLPKVSRELIQQVLLGFKSTKITYNEFLVYFNVSDTKLQKNDEAKAKVRAKWISKYTEVLNSYGFQPNEILKEADKNKDGVLMISELDKVIKLYVKEKDLNYSDLQNILNAMDSNNDGTVTADEYKEMVLQYGAKFEAKAKPEEEDKHDEEEKGEKTAEEIAKLLSEKIRAKYKEKLEKA